MESSINVLRMWGYVFPDRFRSNHLLAVHVLGIHDVFHICSLSALHGRVFGAFMRAHELEKFSGIM